MAATLIKRKAIFNFYINLILILILRHNVYANNNHLNKVTVDDCLIYTHYDVTILVDVCVSENELQQIRNLIYDVTKRLRKSKRSVKLISQTDVENVPTADDLVPPRNCFHRKIFPESEQTKLQRLVKKQRGLVFWILPIEKINNQILKISEDSDGRIILISYAKTDQDTSENIPSFTSNEKDLSHVVEDALWKVCDYSLIKEEERVNIRSRLRRSTSNETSAIRIRGPRVVVVETNSLKITWGGSSSLFITSYEVNWEPHHGAIKYPEDRSTPSFTLFDLEAAVLYKITVTPVAEEGRKGLTSTYIYATAPSRVSNLTAGLRLRKKCKVQKKLQLLYDADFDATEKPEDCNVKKTGEVLEVSWAPVSDESSYVVNIYPKMGQLTSTPRKAVRQTYKNPVPGVNYTISVVTRGPRNRNSEPVETVVMIPPLRPSTLQVRVVNASAVALNWDQPGNGKYDSFVIETVSAFGNNFIRVEPRHNELDTNETIPRTSYNYMLTGLRPDTSFEVRIQTSSFGARSTAVAGKFRTQPLINPFEAPRAVISSNGGISFGYKDGIIKTIMPTSSPVVDALYHRKWEDGEWIEMIIWVEKKSGEIKLTRLPYSNDTTTLVSGLLQVNSLAFDPYGENVYWADMGSSSIGIVNINHNSVKDEYPKKEKLLADISRPVSITIDYVGRALYWTDIAGDIWSSQLDGKHKMHVVLSTTSDKKLSLYYCQVSKSLYWIDPTYNAAYRRSTTDEESYTEKVAGRADFIFTIGEKVLYMDIDKQLIVSLKKDSHEEFEEEFNVAQLGNIIAINGYNENTQEQTLMELSDKLLYPCSPLTSTCQGLCVPSDLGQSSCLSNCEAWEFMCYLSTSPGCISNLLVCDGHNDCSEGEDEELCQFDDICDEGFRCDDSQRCITSELICNGALDCIDGSDELDCITQSQSCSFTNGFCLWSHDPSGDALWKLSQTNTKSMGTGPHIDHTKADKSGNFIFTEATLLNEGDRTRLISVYFARPVCLSFYYHMYGKGIGSLRVLLKTAEEEVEIWNKSGTQGIFWLYGRVSINNHQLYQIVFEAVRGEDYRSDIALDDIAISDGLCSVESDCDFNNDLGQTCGYEISDGWLEGLGKLSDEIKVVENGQTPFSVYEDISDVMGPEWFYHNFVIDDVKYCSDCHGRMIVRNVTQLNYGINYVGVVLCDVDKYKIYLSEDLHGIFRNAGDGVGNGQDHCEFLGSSKSAIAVGNFVECSGKLGYNRQRWGEKVKLGPYGYLQSIFFSPSFYKCDIIFPEHALQDFSVMKEIENRFLFANNTDEEDDIFIQIPVMQVSDAYNNATKSGYNNTVSLVPPSGDTVEYDTVTTASKPSNWCLQFRYFIQMSQSDSWITVTLDNGDILWEKFYASDGWQNISIQLPFPYIKYDVRISVVAIDGAVGLDDVKLLKKMCKPPQVYSCSFDLPIEESCGFTTHGKVKAKQLMVNPLYQRQRFEPYIVKQTPGKGTVLTTMHTNDLEGTILRSPKLTVLTEKYSEMCVTIKYRQPWQTQGEIQFAIKGALSGTVEIFAKQMLYQDATVFPWLTFAADINKENTIALEEDFYIEIYGLNSTWIRNVKLDMIPCIDVLKDECNGGIKCRNDICVTPDQLCNGVDECGDWSDETGCPSKCGNVADHFAGEGELVGLVQPDATKCTYRIHMVPGSSIIISALSTPHARFTTETRTLEISDQFQTSTTSKLTPIISVSEYNEGQTLFYVNSSEVTVEIKLSKSKITTMPISYKVVDENYCSLVCSDNICLRDNKRCDGVRGCKDGKDEEDCTRFTEDEDQKMFEVRHLESPFQPICSDDITISVANAICQQMGMVRANLPLKFKALPGQYSVTEQVRLKQNYTFSYPFYIQAYIESDVNDTLQPGNKKRADRQCKSTTTWVPKCVPFMCGVRPVLPMLKVIGGTRSTKGMWPWMVALMIKGRHNCGGTLISDRYILTAAHCFDDNAPEAFDAVLGTLKVDDIQAPAIRVPIKRGVIHREYDQLPSTPNYDIAVVEMENPIKFSELASPVCIKGERFLPGKNCFIAGYGHVRANRRNQPYLWDAETPLITNEECNTLYKGKIRSSVVCAAHKEGGHGICHGDSGGPLMCESDIDGSWQLYGIASWSVGCAEKGKPDVFTKVNSYISWINENTGLNFTVPVSETVNGTCGGVYYGMKTGVFASPNWPEPYPTDVRCVYTILADLGQEITLGFDIVDTELTYDKISIYNASVNFGRRLKQIHGNRNSDSVVVKTTALHIVFESDKAVVEKGFFGRFNIIGEKQNYEIEGFPLNVQLSQTANLSPDILDIVQPLLGYYFPENLMKYGRPSYKQKHFVLTNKPAHRLRYYNQNGTWTIIPSDYDKDSGAPQDGLKALDVALTPDKVQDQWKVWNGTGWMNVDIIIKIEKDLKIEDFSDSESNSGLINRNSNALSRNGLFSRKKRQILEDDEINEQELIIQSNCQETYTSQNDLNSKYIITTPNFPDKYPSLAHCSWTIRAHTGYNIYINFTLFDLELVSKTCQYDNVTIYNGLPGQNFWNKFCGTLTDKQPIVSHKNILTIVFQSDTYVQRQGFRAIVSSRKEENKTQRKLEDESPPRQLFVCDFDEEDICDFQNDLSSFSNFQWTHQRLDTQSDKTGPPHDDSPTKMGSYMYIEASTPRNPGDRALLISPVITPIVGSPVCVQFSYDMFGLSIGSLNLYALVSPNTPGLETKDMGFLLKPFVRKFGAGLDQDKLEHPFNTEDSPYSVGQQRKLKPWNKAKVTLHLDKDFRLIFEGIRGLEYQSDIAIDNLVVTEGECRNVLCSNDYQYTCKSGKCIPAEVKCNGENNCENGEDEQTCSSSIMRNCHDFSFAPNTTEWLLCKHEVLAKCALHTNDVSEIACDGKYNCFGGHDEGLCSSSTKEVYDSGDLCGKQSPVKHNGSKIELVKSDASNWPWMSGLYLKLHGYEDADADVSETSAEYYEEEYYNENEESTDLDKLVFLCTTVFIKENWLIAPAHCLISEDLDKAELEAILYPDEVDALEEDEVVESEQFNDFPTIPEGAEMPEFEDWNDEEEEVIVNLDDDKPEGKFSYYVKRWGADQSQVPLKVIKIIVHPKYKLKDASKHGEFDPFSNKDFGFKKDSKLAGDIQFDVSQINNDVVLIRIAPTSSEPLSTSSSSIPCVNTLPGWGKRVLTTNMPVNANLFVPPTESFPKEPLVKGQSPFCYAIGHAILYSVEGVSNVKAEFSLAQVSLPLLTGDISSSTALCSMYHSNKTKCQNDLSESDSTKLNNLIIASYEMKLHDYFDHDHGSMLMCEAWDGSWYLAGMYNWLNLHRNAMADKLYSRKHLGGKKRSLTGGILRNGHVIGQPLSVTLHTDIAHVTEWIQVTLDDACPGEFACYNKETSYEQKCISMKKLCDGTIDCPGNYADEINCASGCLYDSTIDPFRNYYDELMTAGIDLPGNLVDFVYGNVENPKSYFQANFTDGDDEFDDTSRSWRNDTTGGRIKANKVQSSFAKMCRWSIKAPQGKVAVLHIPPITTWPVGGGGRIRVIGSDGKAEELKHGMGDTYFTTDVGGVISLQLLPPKNQQYLTGINLFNANYFVEDIGTCKGQHVCDINHCVSLHLICNGVFDCSDLSDELHCRSGCGTDSVIAGPSSGLISSKNYPLPHLGSGECQWTFISQLPSVNTPINNKPTLSIFFEDFETDLLDVLYIFKVAGKRRHISGIIYNAALLLIAAINVKTNPWH